MKRPLLPLVLLPIFLLCAAPGNGQTRTISYQWLNQPCAEIINCEGGCSACNLPEADQVVFGTNAALIGLDACPHPFAVGDNALLLSGWTDAPSDDRRVLVSIIAQTAVLIDSVIVLHRRVADGPSLLRVSIIDQSGASNVVSDGMVPSDFHPTAIAECGVALKDPGMAFASFQVQLQAYSGTGEWYLDELRIVVSELHGDITTGIEEFNRERDLVASDAVDLLGRKIIAAGHERRFERDRIIIVQ